MRVLVIGRDGFLGSHVVKAVQNAGLDAIAMHHDQGDLRATVERSDAVVNCAFPPLINQKPYDPGKDFDAYVAGLATRAGAAFTMLSSRRVYRNGWDAVEEADVAGDGTLYGSYKAMSEAAVRANRGRWTILRPGNIFGQEKGRDSFMGRVLTGLSRDGQVIFDMAASTRRDFLPVELAAEAIVAQVRSKAQGIFNLGSGVATACGDIASWVIKGHGAGRLIVSNNEIRDEFRLDITKSRTAFALACSAEQIREKCLTIGRGMEAPES